MACLSHSQLVPGIVKPWMAALAGRNAVITAQGRWSTDEERESLLAIVTEQGSDTRRMNEALRGVARDVLRRPFGLTRNPNPFGWMMVEVGATGVIAGRPSDRFGVGCFRYSARRGRVGLLLPQRSTVAGADGPILRQARRDDKDLGPAGPTMTILTFVAAAGLTALILYLLVVGGSILLPFVIAIFVAYLISGLVTATKRITVGGRPLPWSVRLTVSVVVVGLLCWLVTKIIVSNSSQLVASAPVYENNLKLRLEELSRWLGFDEPLAIESLFERGRLTAYVRSVAFGLTALVGSSLTIAIYTVFLLLEGHSYEKKIRALFPQPERQALVNRILDRIGAEIQAYIWYKAVFSAATTLASYAIMKYAGLDLAEFWALLIFFLNFIPYLGAWAGVILPALTAIVQFDTPAPILLTIAALAVVQFIGGNIIEPRVMGTGLNISPVVMLLSLSVWGTIWGVAGMFLAVPLMVVLMIVCSHFESTRPIAILMSANGQVGQ